MVGEDESETTVRESLHVVLFVVVLGLIVGGGVYVWQTDPLKSISEDARQCNTTALQRWETCIETVGAVDIDAPGGVYVGVVILEHCEKIYKSDMDECKAK